jgi:hypothetical protein
MFAPNAMTPTEALKRCIDRLPAKDQDFAASLLSAPHPSPNSYIGSSNSPIAQRYQRLNPQNPSPASLRSTE